MVRIFIGKFKTSKHGTISLKTKNQIKINLLESDKLFPASFTIQTISVELLCS
jgi:hypothetical protein